MTPPKGRSSSSTPGESELSGRHEPRRPQPANAADALAERLAARAAREAETVGADEADAGAVGAGELGEPATDELLDDKERSKSRRRKAPGPTRGGAAADATGADGIPELLTKPTDPVEPVEPTERPDH